VRRHSQHELAEIFDQQLLRRQQPPPLPIGGRAVRLADLFSSCGFMTLGVQEACRALGRSLKPIIAVDIACDALDVYLNNFDVQCAKTDSVADLVSGLFGEAPSVSEQEMIRIAGHIDIVVAGPPCQGHSNLNNVTRRSDPKNILYERVARFAELVRPRNIIIENVPDVLHDKGEVVDRTFQQLLALGYHADHAIVDIAQLGLAQRRKRHVLIASLARDYSVMDLVATYYRPPRTVRWAIGDLCRVSEGPSLLDTPSNATSRSRDRMRHLIENDLYDLPNELRPPCHRDNDHSYKSSYGRLRWSAPAQTITSGFGSMGQGRYVHPSKARTLTPREAARLQFIPDYFSFVLAEKRTVLAELIGNAVPPKLTYVLALEMLR
jgi:DNA (cytosine-5)-methyltransferase 1